MIYPIPPKSIPGSAHTVYWEDFLSPDDINTILAQPEWLNVKQAEIGGSGTDGKVDTSVRSNKVSWLGPKAELLPIWEKFSNTVADVNARFFHFDLTGFHEPMQLGVYSEHEQGHYEWHTDSSPADIHVPRKLSMVMLLSDPSEFQGGDLQIKFHNDEATTLECKKGRAWFFPSYTLHRVTPVTKGIRRSLVLWIGGPPFK
jgi:PKHD-type hydroxylase